MRSRAKINGMSDGAEAVRDYLRDVREPYTADLFRSVEAWFATGALEPDEGLINALTTDQLAPYLGLTVAQVNARGDEWAAALADYNDGYRAGARQQVKDIVWS